MLPVLKRRQLLQSAPGAGSGCTTCMRTSCGFGTWIRACAALSASYRADEGLADWADLADKAFTLPTHPW